MWSFDVSFVDCPNNLYIKPVLWDVIPESKGCVANVGPTRVLVAPGGPHVGPMNLAIRDGAHVTSL